MAADRDRSPPVPGDDVAPLPASRGGPVLLRLRSSILGKVLGALVVVLIVSTSVTALVDARLTHDAVAEQTAQVAISNLRVLQEAFAERQRSLVTTLRGLASRVKELDLTEPARRNDLIGRLGAEAVELQLDVLEVVDMAGMPLTPPISVGKLTARLPGLPGQFTTEPTSRLLPTEQGKFVQAVPTVIGNAERPLVLIGGLEFGHDLAFRLRRQVGNLPNVLLVAGNRLAGSTLSTPIVDPPGFSADGSVAPLTPVVATLEGVENVVAYVPVGRSAQDPAGGALGIALPDPAVPLNRALTLRRLVAGALLAVLAVALGWILFRGLTKPLVRLAATAARIAGGRLDEPFVPQGSDEIAQLARSLEHMRQELRAKLDVVASQAAQLQESSQRISAAQDEERRRLARDLHDGIQQQLVMLRLRMGLALEAPTKDREAQQAEVSVVVELAAELDRAIERLREVSHDLYPAILRDRGLAAAVRSYAGRLPLPSTLEVEPDPLPRVSPQVESSAYFLLSEAITNVLKHANANEITVRLTVADGWLTVLVADDGRGFDTGPGAGTGGLIHMEDRVRSFGGSLTIDSRPGGGTAVTARFPAGAGDEEAQPQGDGRPAFLPPADEPPEGEVSPSAVAGRTAQPQLGGSYPAPR